MGLAGGAQAGWGWRGGVVVVAPGYYCPPPYPCYYGDPYFYGYPPRPVYEGRGIGAGSIAIPVQEQLTRKGFYHGPIDGIVGSGTRAAIAAYQRRQGLEVTGTIDGRLLRSLRIYE